MQNHFWLQNIKLEMSSPVGSDATHFIYLGEEVIFYVSSNFNSNSRWGTKDQLGIWTNCPHWVIDRWLGNPIANRRHIRRTQGWSAKVRSPGVHLGESKTERWPLNTSSWIVPPTQSQFINFSNQQQLGMSLRLKLELDARIGVEYTVVVHWKSQTSHTGGWGWESWRPWP